MATTSIKPAARQSRLSGYARAVLRWRRALQMSSLPTASKLDALVLLEFANRNRFAEARRLEVWPSQATVAAVLRRDVKNVRAAISKLTDAGVIRLLQRGGREQGPSRYAFSPAWRDNIEAELSAAGTLGLHPLSRLIASQAGETARMVSIGRKRPIEGGEIARLRGAKSPSNLDESPWMNHRERGTRARGGHFSRARPNGEAVRSTLAPKRASARAALEQYQPSPATCAWLSEHCGAVRDPASPEHVEAWRLWCIEHGKFPRDADAGFKRWMQREQRFALRDAGKPPSARGAASPGRASGALAEILQDLKGSG